MTSSMSAESAAGSVGRRLSRAQLDRVLCQVRWQQLSKFNLDPVADQLAQIIGDEYPLRDAQQELQFILSPSGVTQQMAGMIHRFQSADRTWTISLGSQFLALETTAYDGHVDFIRRLTGAITGLFQIASIPLVTRIGYRYTNRLADPADIADLPKLFVEGVLGGLAHGETAQLKRTVTESLYGSDDDVLLLVRSALLEPEAVLEPGLTPIKSTSWILDLDAYRESPAGLPVETLPKVAKQLSERAGNHFWSVITPQFIERFK